jgi:dTDP-4-dehydrorhamnose reductase
MTVHVTGATGFLGRELLRLWPSATGERVDVRDADAVGTLLDRLRPDAVIHTAYRQEGPGAWEVTVDGAENVAGAAHAVRARLVHVSTDVVFDGRKGDPYVESDDSCPATDYGRAKAESERRVLEAHPSALVVRTSLLVGGPGHEAGKHERAALEETMAFYEDEIRCPTQVGDLASALLELAGLDVSGPLHVAGADALSRADLAELVVGRPVRRIPAPPDRPLDCTLDCTRAQALLMTRLRGANEVFSGLRTVRESRHGKDPRPPDERS